MNTDVTGTGAAGGSLGIVTRELQVRVLNCSPSGCLLETDIRLETGATASLRMEVDGTEFSDDIEVVRCQRVEGAGALYQVGVRFLWNAPPNRKALRRVVWKWCHHVEGDS
jgi:PilZ domain